MKRIHHNSSQSSSTPRANARRPSGRRGTAIIEGAIVISVFLVILLGTLDLGLAVLRFNLLSEGARQLARSASLHGMRAAPEMKAWGPGKYTGTAGDGSQYADAVNDILITMKPQNVKITLEWLDAGNATGDRVQVRLDMSHHTIIPFLFGKNDLQLTAKSVMRIEH